MKNDAIVNAQFNCLNPSHDGHGTKSFADTEPRVQLSCEGHIPKGIWVSERVPAGAGLCVSARTMFKKTKNMQIMQTTMARAYKNFWSLNTDEAVVTGILRGALGRNMEVLMPLNAQLKDVDLVVIYSNNRQAITIQVKGSRAFEPKVSEIKRFGDGSTGWFVIQKDAIERSKADYFIFLVYVLEQMPGAGRRIIQPHTITIPTPELQKAVKKHKKVVGTRYHFYFWVNPKTHKAFDYRDSTFSASKYLDSIGLKAIRGSIK